MFCENTENWYLAIVNWGGGRLPIIYTDAYHPIFYIHSICYNSKVILHSPLKYYSFLLPAVVGPLHRLSENIFGEGIALIEIGF